jgi:hypothetical protein
MKPQIDVKIDATFGIPPAYWMSAGDSRLKEASASREFEGIASIGTGTLKMRYPTKQELRDKALAKSRCYVW